MLVFDTEELVFRARDYYAELKSYGPKPESVKMDQLKKLSELLFCTATKKSLKELEEWLESNNR